MLFMYLKAEDMSIWWSLKGDVGFKLRFDCAGSLEG